MVKATLDRHVGQFQASFPVWNYTIVMTPTTVLFVCYANTCRSPMAEAILRAIGGPTVVVISAGLHPTGRVADLSLRALQFSGYSVEGLTSKGLEAIDLETVDIAISLMGPPGLSALPCRLTAEKISWSIRDPFGEDEDAYASTIKTLEKRIRGFCVDRRLLG